MRSVSLFDSLLEIEDPVTKTIKRMKPGELRARRVEVAGTSLRSPLRCLRFLPVSCSSIRRRC